MELKQLEPNQLNPADTNTDRPEAKTIHYLSKSGFKSIIQVLSGNFPSSIFHLGQQMAFTTVLCLSVGVFALMNKCLCLHVGVI